MCEIRYYKPVSNKPYIISVQDVSSTAGSNNTLYACKKIEKHQLSTEKTGC